MSPRYEGKPTFAPHARASNAGADDHVRALVVGNAADTDALIAQAAAPGRAGRPIDHDDRRGHTTA
jgi:hypothetical protein